MMSRGVLVIANVLAIPLIIRYLGAERFGVWTTVTTTLTMLLVLDFGVANSLTNFISEAYATDDREHASRYTSTAVSLMIGVSMMLGFIALIAWPYIRWNNLFNISSATEQSEVSHAVAAALFVFLVDLPARLAIKILGGYQELGVANLFVGLGAAGSLIAVLLLVYLHAGLATLVAGPLGALVAADIGCLIWLLYFHKPWLRPRIAYISRSTASRMMRQGSGFFMLQIAGLLVFDSDNLVIAHYLGPAEVAPYTVAWRLATYAAAVQGLIFPALWPAFSEALERGEIDWVRNMFWRVMGFTLAFAVAFAGIFAVGGRWLIRVWATSAAVPSETLILLMCVWVIMSTFMNNTVAVVVATGRIALQGWLSLAVGVLNLAISIWLVQLIGSTGVILGTILSYLIVLVVPQTVSAWKILHRKENISIASVL